MDNILIYLEDLLEHKLYIKKILHQLQKTRLQADIKKNKFNIISTKFLGFIININCMAINPKKILIIKNWKSPILIKDI